MTFGDPVIYTCPFCGKQMKMTTYNSYTVRSSDVYSDGYSTGRPHFTPDLAKCPSCSNLFFRHNIKDKKKIKYRETGKIKDIKDPDRSDLIKAFKQGVAKTWKEELQLLEDLWRDFNDDLRHGNINLSDDEIEYWTVLCSALLPLAEKKCKEIQRKKTNENYDEDDKKRDISNYLVQIAELNRNILNFDNCMEIINSLDSDWDWIKDQFALECERKNPCPFELLKQSDLDLENNERADKYDYMDRARKHENRRLFDKALADYNKAEELGHNDYYTLYIERAQLYSQIFEDRINAIADYSKAISIAQTSLTEEWEKEKPLNIECYTNWILFALFERSYEYELKGELENSYADINSAIKVQKNYSAWEEFESIKRNVHEYEAAEMKKEKDAIKATDPEYYEAVDLYEAGEYTKAVKTFKTLANNGHSGAQCKLGYCYYSGRGVDQNDKESFDWYMKAAKNGNAEAQHEIGDKYLIGNGVEEDKVKAAQWHRKAAEQGYDKAQRDLAYFYEHGTGVEQSYTEAAKWFTKAAQQGNYDAQEKLGEYYTKGLGVEQDFVKAFEFYEKCAQYGVSSALLSLGDCYMEGKGVEQNYAAAVKYYSKLGGWNIALYKLGICYEEGKGVEQNLPKAIELYRKSADTNSYQPAIEKLEKLMKK